MKQVAVQSSRARTRSIDLFVAVLFLCLPVLALDASHSVTQYRHVSLTRQENGLPGIITSLAQTRDGVLWIGTELGLLRFDGVRFTSTLPPLGPPLGSDSINALMAASDGSLWIGTKTGLAHWNAGKLSAVPVEGRVAGASVRSFLESRDHTVWAALVGSNAGGLCRIEQERLKCERPETFGRAASLFEDPSGKLWVGGIGLLSCLNGSTTQTFRLRTPNVLVSSITEDRSGQVWLSTLATGGLLHLDHGQLIPSAIPSIGQAFQPGDLLSDRDGGLWIATFGQGLIHLHQGRAERFTTSDGLSSDLVRALYEDHEGNIWAATDNGLDRFSEFAVTTFSKREGLSSALVTSMYPASSGEIWVGTTAGLDRIENNIAAQGSHSGLASNSITGLFEDSSNTLWVASNRGLFYRDKAGLHATTLPPDHPVRSLTSVVQTGGDIWFADPQQGLFRVHERRLAQFVPSSELNHQAIWAMEAGHDTGEVWLGLGDGSIADWKQGRVSRWYHQKDGLPGGPVADLHLGRDGTLWIATHNGLSRLSHDRIETVGTANGLPCERIQAMVEDDAGDLWLNATCGLIRLPAADLAAWSDDPRRQVRPVVYDASDGMSAHSGSLGYFRHAGKSPDGRLWFVTVDGVSVIDPRHLPVHALAPPVQVEKITVDGTNYKLGSQIQLPPRPKTLDIDYAAFSFVAPEKVFFRYRIEEMEHDWHRAGSYRRATYTNLPPGTYHFLVQAAINSDVWNNASSLAFVVLPAFFQTFAFRLMCAVAAMLLLWALYRLRLHQVAARMKLRFETRYAERVRIANELHDDLLQNLSGFILQLDGLAKIVSDPVRVQERIRDLRDQTEQSLHETRETIWDIRSRSSERGFQDSLQDMADQIAKGKPVRIVLTVSGDRRPIEPGLAGELLRITREAIGNSIRHSGAHLITVLVAYGPKDALQINVSDDGSGFDLDQGSRKMKHWGLSSMRDNARKIGAELNITTAPGKGTRVEISVRTNSRSK